MKTKWKTYLVTLVSYATIHSIRTMWSAIKSDLTQPPFNYQLSYLGTLDMVVLFVLAISMNILGPKVQKWGAKKGLLLSLYSLFFVSVLIGIMLKMNFTSNWIYIVLFGFGIGIFSSLGWPSCLCLVSYYFDKKNGMALSAWNGCSQLGDFIALVTYYLIVISKQWVTESAFFLTGIYLLIMGLSVQFSLPNITTAIKNDHQQEQQKQQQMKQNVIQLNQEKIVDCLDNNKNINMQQIVDAKYSILDQISEKEENSSKQAEADTKNKQTQQISKENSTEANIQLKVNILTVWCLPGVALNVLSYSLIKSVNAFVVGWLVYYLLMLQLESEAVLMTILWSASIFIGGLICGILNKTFNKLVFVFQLAASSICFILLQEFHVKIYKIQIILFIIACALFYGGPYSLMSTAIPIILGNEKSIQKFKNAKASIISLMQGFGLLVCGLSLLLIPVFGVRHIHTAGAVYCGIASFLLLGQYFREKRQKNMKSKMDLNLNT